MKQLEIVGLQPKSTRERLAALLIGLSIGGCHQRMEAGNEGTIFQVGVSPAPSAHDNILVYATVPSAVRHLPVDLTIRAGEGSVTSRSRNDFGQVLMDNLCCDPEALAKADTHAELLRNQGCTRQLSTHSCGVGSVDSGIRVADFTPPEATTHCQQVNFFATYPMVSRGLVSAMVGASAHFTLAPSQANSR